MAPWLGVLRQVPAPMSYAEQLPTLAKVRVKAHQVPVAASGKYPSWLYERWMMHFVQVHKSPGKQRISAGVAETWRQLFCGGANCVAGTCSCFAVQPRLASPPLLSVFRLTVTFLAAVRLAGPALPTDQPQPGSALCRFAGQVVAGCRAFRALGAAACSDEGEKGRAVRLGSSRGHQPFTAPSRVTK